MSEPATPSMPPDPVSALAEAAGGLHEVFVSYMRAGFSRQEALFLTGQILAASLTNGPQGGTAS